MLFPFGDLNNEKFLGFINNKNEESKVSNSSLILKLRQTPFNQFNSIFENDSDPENAMQSKYYDIDEL